MARLPGEVESFWKSKCSNPTIIYCDTDEAFKKFGSATPVPALVHVKFGGYIVISKDALDVDIISHELSHVQFYRRIGFYNWSFRVPRWFDEGLAMQNDYRAYYSEDTLKLKSANYSQMPSPEQMRTPAQFYPSSMDDLMLNFMASKHYVKTWYSPEKLEKLINRLNSGMTFDESYRD